MLFWNNPGETQIETGVDDTKKIKKSVLPKKNLLSAILALLAILLFLPQVEKSLAYEVSAPVAVVNEFSAPDEETGGQGGTDDGDGEQNHGGNDNDTDSTGSADNQSETGEASGSESADNSAYSAEVSDSENADTARTDDNFKNVLYLLMIGVSAGIIVAMLMRRKRNSFR